MMNPVTALCLLLWVATTLTLAQVTERESVAEDGMRSHDPGERDPRVSWFDCRLFRKPITSIQGCTPLGPVYQTTCSGRCFSKLHTNPSIGPNSTYQRCQCCKPTTLDTTTVKIQCPVSRRRPVEMTVTCDNRLKVYIDGVLQSAPAEELNTWETVSRFRVPTGTQVVGLECHDRGVVGGIIAEGVSTDDSWQCSPRYSTGWNLPTFRENWPSAYEIGFNGMRPWGVIDGLGRGAKWIWTTGWHGENTKMYCRKVLQPEYVVRDYTYTVIADCGCRSCPSVRPLPDTDAGEIGPDSAEL